MGTVQGSSQTKSERLVMAARAMAPLVDAHRGNFDRDRNLPPVLVDAMHRAGFFRLWLPRSPAAWNWIPSVF